MEKAELRQIMSNARGELGMTDARRLSSVVAGLTKPLIQWSNVRRLHVYRSNRMWREVDTSWLEAYVSTVWPQIEVVVADVSKSASLPNGPFDVIIVPLLAFDERKNRLGLGSGWYDRFLATQPTATTIGLAYEFQKVSQLAAEPHDVPLSIVVTERTVY